MANRDALPRLRAVQKVPKNRIVDLDLALFDKDHDPRCGELFSDRGQLEDSVGCHRHIVLKIRESISSDLFDSTVTHHGQRKTGNLSALHLGLNVVVDRVCQRGYRRGDESQEQRAENEPTTSHVLPPNKQRPRFSASRYAVVRSAFAYVPAPKAARHSSRMRQTSSRLRPRTESVREIHSRRTRW